MDEHAEFGIVPPFHAALLIWGWRIAGWIAAWRWLGAGRFLCSGGSSGCYNQ
jgi:hypothetical protein